MNIEISIKPFFNDSLTCCEPLENLITLGYEFKLANKLLLDNDFDTFISDVITHEFIHALLYQNFNSTVCKLFDAVEHFITMDMCIKEKVFCAIRKTNTFPMTWHNSITKYGFKAFLDTYHIDNDALVQAYIIAGGK